MSKLPIVLVALATIACGSETSSPTSPSTAPAIRPAPHASLQPSGAAAWDACQSGNCVFNVSIQNVGDGCATSTTVVARFYGPNQVQVGSDIHMETPGTTLATRTIRPQEVVALAASEAVPATSVAARTTFQLFPSWTDVACK